MADDEPTDTDTDTSGNGNGLQGMSRVNLLLHEGMIRGLGVLLASYQQWVRSHRTPANRPPPNGNGNGSRRPNGH